MIPTFVESLHNTIDVKSVDQFFQKDKNRTLKVLREVRPEGRLEGNRYKLGSLLGGAGGSFDFNVDNHNWGDWAKNEGQHGLVNFVAATLRMTVAQTLIWMADKKHCTTENLRKKMDAEEGDPLVFPIPADQAFWEVAIESDSCRKDKAVVSRYWEYKDVDGQLLGFVYRVDGRRTSKEIYTLTYRAESGWTKKAWGAKILPVYGLEELSRKFVDRVVLVEGEKAREALRKILPDSWVVLGYSGVRGSENSWFPEAEFWAEADVTIWPDNDAAGKEAAKAIQSRLQRMKFKPKSVKIVRVDRIPGVGPKWDPGDWTEESGINIEASLEEAENQDSFEAISKDWILVREEKRFYNVSDRGYSLDTAAFDLTFSRYNLKGQPPSKQFASSLENESVNQLDFVPGGDQILRTGSSSYLNEWSPSPVMMKAHEIAEDASISDELIAENAKYFIAHLARFCGGEIVEPETDPKTGLLVPGTEGRTLLDALTWHFSELVKRPMDKRGWVPLLVSEKNGTGKSYFGDMMNAIQGRTISLNVKTFLSDYHDWRDGTLFYEIAEVKSVESVEVYNEIKKLHSYRPFSDDRLRDRENSLKLLNIKGGKQKRQRDFLNGYITANDLFPLALVSSTSEEAGDRRLLVIRNEQAISEAEAELMFDDELKHRPEWIAAYLLRFTSQFRWNPSWAPVTAHKKLMMNHDRRRASLREEKQGLGKATGFLHFIQWAIREKVGCFNRRVMTGEEIRELADVRRMPAPFEHASFMSCLERVGIKEGPQLKINKLGFRRFYTLDETMLGQPDQDWEKHYEQGTTLS